MRGSMKPPNPLSLMKFESDKLLLFTDLAGTLLLGIEGANQAISGNLDFLGVMVLAFATALAGGIIRDLLIGAVPPDSLQDWRYAAAAFLGGGMTFFMHHFVQAIPPNAIMVLDAAGLAFLAVAGTQKALDYKMHPLIAVLLGTVTGVGGGALGEMMLARVPEVLRADIYATAALVGAAAMVIARKLKLPATWAALLGGTVCFLLRVISVWQHWNLPKLSGG
jgi:uncharacterized membrane protein YeiH